MDGEGCFDFQKMYTKGLKTARYRPRIRVVSTTAATLPIVDSILKEHTAGHHISWRFPENRRWSPSWEVTVAGYQKGLRMLLWLTPLLRTKREDAEVLLDFVRARENKNPKLPYDQHELDLIAKFGSRRR